MNIDIETVYLIHSLLAGKQKYLFHVCEEGMFSKNITFFFWKVNYISLQFLELLFHWELKERIKVLIVKCFYL